MGAVYKAEDVKLGRYVALKFLPASLAADIGRRERFIEEAKAASLLDHPNVGTVYEIDQTTDGGQLFIGMAYYEGETLEQKIKRGPLPLEEAVGIAIQAAEGLTAAHEQKIAHLDVKPANLLVTPSGVVKIVDFGLARLAGRNENAPSGTFMGTAFYMSPEQARGEGADHRTDIWALGVVLYQMISGRLPFSGDYEQALIYSIIYENPPSLNCSPREASEELNRIFAKALAKNSGARYPAMGEMLKDLRSLKKNLVEGFSKPRLAVAVLPFADLSYEKDQEYFCDGLTEELINALTRINELRVASRTTVFQFKGKAEDIRQLGGRLNVSVVLEGSVRTSGERLRISVQLVNVDDGYPIWSERYDRVMKDIFSVQEEIAQAIVAKLEVGLLPEEKARLTRRHTENLEAYTLYLKGRYFWNQRTKPSLEKAIDYFEEAIGRDPNYAMAYAGLADSYGLLSLYGQLPLSESYPKAKAAADKALEIDPSLAEAQTSRAQITATYEWDFPKALREFRRAIELNPNYGTAHHWYSTVLTEAGRMEEALAEIRRAQELEPVTLTISVSVGLTFYYGRQYDRSIDQAKKALELDSNFALAHRLLAIACEQKRMYAEAIDQNRRWGDLTGDGVKTRVALGYVYALSGRQKEALEVLEKFRPEETRRKDLAPGVAFVHTALGDFDRAFEWLEKAYRNRSGALTTVKVDPRLDPLRSDPRFTVLLKKMGLDE